MATSEALSSQEVHAAWAKLADDVRTGVLLALRDGRPFGSHVPNVFGEHWTCAYIHVSRLALHDVTSIARLSHGAVCFGPGQAGKESPGLTVDESSGEAV
jgi:hypothetical protein